MRFPEIVKLLAAKFPDQIAFLGNLPENTAEADFDPCNDIYRMSNLFLESLSVHEGDGGSEGIVHWQARTEIAHAEDLHTHWLATAVQMLMDLNKPFLFTRHGLRIAKEWQLVRHLAQHVCEEMGWIEGFRYPNFETLWNALSDGLLDEQIERKRWHFKNETM